VSYPRIASLKTADAFSARLAALNVELGFEPVLPASGASALAQRIDARPGSSISAGNRWCILPMEGWDGTTDGHPTDLTRRRWTHFGISGAKIIWGGEAVAVRHDGRANPHQLVISERTLSDLAALRVALDEAHRERYGATDDLLIGIQLTHSGRYSKPTLAGPAPRVAYRHPVLDARLGISDDRPVFTDEELDRLVDDFVAAAVRAHRAGFAFADIKHCHGYLGHELLSARHRPGKYGGSLDNRLRFLTNIAAGIRASAPGLEIGVRLSAFDMVPFTSGRDEVGVPEVSDDAYTSAFGFTRAGAPGDIDDAHALLSRLPELGIHWVCLSAGSPYYNPHIQRPAIFPPSDGYLPPEDPLVGVARQIAATAALKARHPALVIIGSGYSYLQEWIPHVAEHTVRHGLADAVGLGRLVLSYPEMPADMLAGRPLRTKRLCRTFSDCTTAPRNGLVSGCYPLDPFFVQHESAVALKEIKKAMKAGTSA
jgi:2,4-dienoyl-CoA reductase-like NADH-dependent reductase (Old Yellow Enzyme family)